MWRESGLVSAYSSCPVGAWFWTKQECHCSVIVHNIRLWSFSAILRGVFHPALLSGYPGAAVLSRFLAWLSEENKIFYTHQSLLEVAQGFSQGMTSSVARFETVSLARSLFIRWHPAFLEYFTTNKTSFRSSSKVRNRSGFIRVKTDVKMFLWTPTEENFYKLSALIPVN